MIARGGHAYSALRLLEPAALDELNRMGGRLVGRDAPPFLELADALPESLVADLALEFPPVGTDPLRLRLLRDLGYGFRRLDELLGCPEMIELLGRIRGEKHLTHDFDYESGGAHQVTNGAAIGLPVAEHPRGWRRRLTVVVVLDPEWTPWSGEEEIAPRAASRCRIVILPTEDWVVGDFAIMPPREGGSPRCRYVIAHYYAQGDKGVRPIGGKRPGSASDDEMPPFSERLRAAAGNPRHAHSILAAELARLSQAINRLGHEVNWRADQFRDALWPVCTDGSSPLTEAELALCERLPLLWQPVLDALARTAETVDQTAIDAHAMPPLPIEGDVVVEDISGRWRDGWVGPLLIVRLAPKRPVRAITVEGFVPNAIAAKQRLFATVSECVHQTLPPITQLKWRFAITDTPGEPITVRLSASSAWRPIDDGTSGDTRPLAWYLSRFLVEHDR